jgi:hypothetical protein
MTLSKTPLAKEDKTTSMKKISVCTIALLCCLCLFSTTSKECGKIVSEKVPAAASDKKAGEEKSQVSEDSKTEFSFIKTLFFQTT